MRIVLAIILAIAALLMTGGCASSGSPGSTAAPAALGPTTGGPVHVKGYFKKDGTYVKPHTRRSPRK
jgi:hypothetical protein